jgi:DNA polymerase-1
VVKRPELFLIDATFLLEASEEAFRGVPLFTSSNGQDNTFVYGFLRDLLRLRSTNEIQRAIVVVGREANKVAAGAHLDQVCGLLTKLHVAVVREPDVAVGSLCKQLAARADWLVTTNRSLFQLVGTTFSVIHLGKETEIVTRETLKSAEGILPEQVPSFLALTVGPKGTVVTKGEAIRMLELHAELEAVLRDPSLLSADRLRRRVSANREVLLRRLSDLKVKETAWRPAFTGGADLWLLKDNQETRQVVLDHGFRSLLRLLSLPNRQRMLRSVRETKASTSNRAVVDEAGLRELGARVLDAGLCAVDTEASDKDPRKASLFGVAFSVREGEGFYVPITQADLKGTSSQVVQAWLRRLARKELRFVGHNLRYDYVLLCKHQIEMKHVHFDTMLSACECFGDWDFFNLAAVVERLLGKTIKRYRDVVNEGQTFMDVPFKDLVEHACTDADMTLRLYHRLTSELKVRGLEDDFTKETMGLLTMLGNKECEGVKVSKKAIGQTLRRWEHDAAVLRNAVMSEAGQTFDLDSKEEVTNVLQERGLLGHGGRHSATRTQLAELGQRHPLPRLIVRYQRTQGRIEQLKTVWGKVKDDKLFPLFNQVRAEHGCLSWADPTLFDLDPALCREVVLDKAVRERTANREAALDILEEVTGDPMLKQDREREVWPFLDGGPPIGDVDLTGC